jgi:hypothetical protein
VTSIRVPLLRDDPGQGSPAGHWGNVQKDSQFGPCQKAFQYWRTSLLIASLRHYSLPINRDRDYLLHNKNCIVPTKKWESSHSDRKVLAYQRYKTAIILLWCISQLKRCSRDPSPGREHCTWLLVVIISVLEVVGWGLPAGIGKAAGKLAIRAVGACRLNW